MKSIFKILLSVLILGNISSCSNDDSTPYLIPATKTTFKATTMNGANEVPSNASTATGSAELIYNNSTKKFTITVTYSGLTPISGHVHKGAIGASGPPVFAFSSLTSPIVYTSAALDATQRTDLFANQYYVNLHSATYPDGEIRGQLLKQNGGDPY